MYAALRSDVKRTCRPVTDQSIGDTARGGGKMRSDSNTNQEVSKRNSEKCPIASNSSKPDEIDEWELLDEALDDTHHYFSRHMSIARPTKQYGQSNFGSLFRKENHFTSLEHDRAKSAMNYAGRKDQSQDWSSLPDYAAKMDGWSLEERRQQTLLSRASSKTNEDDDEPYTTLDSIIAAAKRLPVNRLSSTPLVQSNHTLLDQVQTNDLQPTPLPDSMSSLNSSASISNVHRSSDRLQHEWEKLPSDADMTNKVAPAFRHSSQEKALDKFVEVKNVMEQGRRDCLNNQMAHLDSRPAPPRSQMLARGFTWSSTDSMQYVTLSTLKRLPPAQKSLLGSLDSEDPDS